MDRVAVGVILRSAFLLPLTFGSLQLRAQQPLPRDSARVLAPIAVTVKTNRILDAVGFTSRMKHGVGRYITSEEIVHPQSDRG